MWAGSAGPHAAHTASSPRVRVQGGLVEAVETQCPRRHLRPLALGSSHHTSGQADGQRDPSAPTGLSHHHRKPPSQTGRNGSHTHDIRSPQSQPPLEPSNLSRDDASQTRSYKTLAARRPPAGAEPRQCPSQSCVCCRLYGACSGALPELSLWSVTRRSTASQPEFPAAAELGRLKSAVTLPSTAPRGAGAPTPASASKMVAEAAASWSWTPPSWPSPHRKASAGHPPLGQGEACGGRRRRRRRRPRRPRRPTPYGAEPSLSLHKTITEAEGTAAPRSA